MSQQEFYQYREAVREFLEVTEPAGDTIHIDDVTEGDALKFLDGHWQIVTNEKLSIRAREPYLFRLQKAVNHLPNWV